MGLRLKLTDTRLERLSAEVKRVVLAERAMLPQFVLLVKKKQFCERNVPIPIGHTPVPQRHWNAQNLGWSLFLKKTLSLPKLN